MELKTSIPLLVVRQFGNATPLKTRYGGETGVVGPWWSGRPSRTHRRVRVLIPADPSGKVEGN